ncbi:hypothetical protein JTB14_028581 [Gonioctena quinquepunctata]|nr:hypothetical protein JTB14_028581 [Gonioctena quinquepunctata]
MLDDPLNSSGFSVTSEHKPPTESIIRNQPTDRPNNGNSRGSPIPEHRRLSPRYKLPGTILHRNVIGFTSPLHGYEIRLEVGMVSKGISKKLAIIGKKAWSEWSTEGKSATYARKRVGPKTRPWETHERTWCVSE